jgi:UDP-N-acetylmuramate--alanine ligase
MIKDLNGYNKVFFIGIAGTGMSALAQFLAGNGKNVSGSDRYFQPDTFNDTKEKLEAEGIKCFPQNGGGLAADVDLVIVSSAIEDTVPEVKQAKDFNIPIIKRSELLALIAQTKRTIAVAGTSGKSTTSAMLYEILEEADMQPSIISGAGLVSIIRKEKIGNAKVGAGEWLVIEADESDGSIVQYKPEIGLLLNVEKDHKEMDELKQIFEVFKNNCSGLFVVNQSNIHAASFSENRDHDFSVSDSVDAGYVARNFQQDSLTISFTIRDVNFQLNTVGKHNMENALAATAVANQMGVPLSVCAAALKKYEGIYRRHQVIGKKDAVFVIDDYAHNPAKCAASIEACQPIAEKVVAWFQPHGYGPTRFLKNDFVDEISRVLRPQDEIWMSEIFYAGGTAEKNISSAELIQDIKQKGHNAFFVEDRNAFLDQVRPHLTGNAVLLLMGARDPSLEEFAKNIWKDL